MMDPEVSVLLHCQPGGGLLESQVQVELSERFNRCTDPSLERQIEEMWAVRVSQAPWLFNGAKFRLHSFCLASPKYPSPSCVSPKHPPCTHSSKVPTEDCVEGWQNKQRREDLCNSAQEGVTQHAGSTLKQVSCTCGCTESSAERPSQSDKNTDNEENGPLLILRLGLTCYKDYLGTNWSCRVDELRQRGEVEFSDPLALLSQPLGVGAIMCTDDGQVVLIRRSQRVAEAGGLLDIPGGHPEPKVVCERLGQAVCEEQISLGMMLQRPEAVVSELFSSICAEIRDEVNIPLSSLGEPVLMGVALNHTSAGRPSAEFYISCSLASEEVRKLYWKGGVEAHESTDIIFLDRTEVAQLDSSSPLWSELCPSAKGAVLLYQTVKPEQMPKNGSR
ncbi:LOW QUALITY PROTEIN: uridine diphosphate glucose pyrophosphatase NUDT22 [Mastacembelus armatus]|uniref:LOW QUALITY PROTEIN: uridine diphosphate glucose pyrophosphatase NUDT22 n=1 Tax=Mastacembelus armatus TaxID=205130 RepID=UPI000E45B8DC|nr:LOW QUALITY PROTEIN: uridine diphosphate glucose pyrophosphatase NUDT22 [Mastacembelus armatus]